MGRTKIDTQIAGHYAGHFLGGPGRIKPAITHKTAQKLVIKVRNTAIGGATYCKTGEKCRAIGYYPSQDRDY
ncbi:hypothetical protein ACFL2Q_06325 [Thermodesulfobacteriota bacterium]